jgi:hypothetical protein
MKEEDLIKKLENVELPDIELQSHRSRLKMALLDSDCLKKQRGVNIPELAKSKLIEVKDIMIRSLVSRQPVWKTATVSITALVLILGLSLVLPSFNTNSVYAKAEEITRSSAEVKAALGGEEIEVVRIEIGDMDTGKVIARGADGSVMAGVDLKTGRVTEVEASFTVDEQAVIEIAKADPGVRELLDAGAVIGDVSYMHTSGQLGSVETGIIEDFSETLVMLDINGAEDSYVAHINLSEGKVDKLLKFVPMAPPSGSSESYSIPDTGMDASGESR